MFHSADDAQGANNRQTAAMETDCIQKISMILEVFSLLKPLSHLIGSHFPQHTIKAGSSAISVLVLLGLSFK